MSENNTLFLVDGSSLAFRSFFALLTTAMRNAEGLPTWAVHGFFSSLFDLIDKYNPHSLAVCFDMAEPTFRHEAYEDYKANRDEMPDDLAVQWPLIKEAVQALSIPLYELAGFEADDIIGTVAKQARNRNLKTVILTGDQDAFQLLDDDIQVLMPGKEGLKVYGRQEVFEKLGVYPEQVIDYKGLCGDSSDNIPGVKGIGPKTAVNLLSQYKNLEGIYEHIDEIKSASQRTKLTEGKLNAFESRDLATIRLDVPLDFDFEHCRLSCNDPAKIAEIFRTLECRSLLKRLPKAFAHFNDGLEAKIDPELLTIAPRSRMKSGSTMGRPLTEKSAALASSSQTAAPSSEPATNSGGRQLSLLDAFSGSAASAESSISVALLSPGISVPEILKNKSEIQSLKRELEESGLFSMSLLCSAGPALESQLFGVSFCLPESFVMEEGRVSLKAEPKPARRCVYIPLENPGEAPVSRDEVLEILSGLLSDERVGKIVFDAKNTANALSLHQVKLNNVVFDPMLASYILNPDENHKLDAQCQSILLRKLSELPSVSAKKGPDLEFLPQQQLAERSCQEALAVHDLCIAYLKAMDEDQKDLLWTMDLPLAAVLAQLEQNGVQLDISYFKSLGKELSAEIAKLEKEIHLLAGHPFNVGSPLQLQKVLFEELNLPTKSKTKSGYSTDASVLESLLDAHAIVPKILEWRHLSKLNSTYVEALPKLVSARDGRLHGEFNQTVTATGRLSSTNPNLQNIPIRTEIGRRIRAGFIAGGKESIILSADYSQIELRLLAHMSGDEKLIEAFKNDEDIHARTAALVFEKSVSDVSEEERRIGKTLNFALIYQQGAFATGQSLGISTREAQGFIEKYFTSFPKVKAFMTRVIEDGRKNGYVQTLWGRRRYFSHLNDRNEGIRKADERAAFNAPLQGTAADLMKLAMIALQKELSAKQMKTRLILQVHDELVLDVPKEELDLARELLLSCMSMGQPLSVPLKVDSGCGENWRDAK